MKRKYLKYVIMGAVAAIVATFILHDPEKKEEGKPRDYQEIAASGELNVTTEYNSISYHVEGDTVSGFHYELIQAFAKEKGLNLHITPEMDLGKQIAGINNGTYDIIAHGILVTSESKDSLLNFTTPILLNKQVLVQRVKQEVTDSVYISNQLELAGKTVYIPHESPISYRIHNLSKEIGDTIIIKEMEKYGAEQLMALVAHGDIDYAVCEAGIAQAVLPDFPQLDINTGISFNQFYAWGVSKQSPLLLDSLNTWLHDFMQSKAYKTLLRKYHQND